MLSTGHLDMQFADIYRTKPKTLISRKGTWNHLGKNCPCTSR